VIGGEITGHTRIYAHLAHPTAHVRTPQTFNRGFTKRGLDAVAVSIDVTPEDLPELMRGLRCWRNLAGIGVTMPHKETIAAHVDVVEGLGAAIGAVNLIRREADGSLTGCNTDGAGFIAGMRENGYEPAGRHTLLAGVGGAGRAIAFHLAEAGVASLRISNRTFARAEALAREVARVFPAVPVSAAPPDPAGCDLVVNSTPLGMHPGDPLPVDADRLEPGAVVADIIMAPPVTALMEAAAARGCHVHPGLPMLTTQLGAVVEFLHLEEAPAHV
jgi:shikimate dehydrogenase